MPRESSRESSYDVLPVIPIGSTGLDLFTDPALLPPSALIRAENIRLASGAVERRGGALKLSRYTGTSASLVFGATTKYATIPAAAQRIIPKGGFALKMHFTATRPSGGNTAYILSSRPNGQSFHVLSVTLSDAGVITVAWTDTGAASRSVACTAVDDGATVHLLAVFDAYAGTFTVYINGASSGTPLTGLTSTLAPDQTASVIWAFAVEKESSAAVTANSHFSGKLCSATLFALRGTRPSSGTTSLVSVLRKHAFRTWPTPQMDGVLFHYDFDSTTTLYDRSEFKSHGTITGVPTADTEVGYASWPGHAVHTIQSTTGQRTNVFAAAGGLYYEVLKSAV